MKGFREPDGMKGPVGYRLNEDPEVCTLNCTLKFENKLNMYCSGSFS